MHEYSLLSGFGLDNKRKYRDRISELSPSSLLRVSKRLRHTTTNIIKQLKNNRAIIATNLNVCIVKNSTKATKATQTA